MIERKHYYENELISVFFLLHKTIRITGFFSHNPYTDFFFLFSKDTKLLTLFIFYWLKRFKTNKIFINFQLTVINDSHHYGLLSLILKRKCLALFYTSIFICSFCFILHNSKTVRWIVTKNQSYWFGLMFSICIVTYYRMYIKNGISTFD